MYSEKVFGQMNMNYAFTVAMYRVGKSPTRIEMYKKVYITLSRIMKKERFIAVQRRKSCAKQNGIRRIVLPTSPRRSTEHRRPGPCRSMGHASGPRRSPCG